MWSVAPLGNISRETKYNVLGRPLKQIIPYVELWKQGEIVKPLTTPENLRTETFYLGDSGLAMKLTSESQPGRPPIIYCSPDRLHNQNPSFACDIWSYMCIFAELYLGLVPFTSWAKGGVVTTMVDLFGPLPKEWKGHYFNPDKTLDSWYDQDYEPGPEMTLPALLGRVRPEIDAIERHHILSVMYRGFNCSPEKRPTASQLLEDPSFKALMEMYCH